MLRRHRLAALVGDGFRKLVVLYEEVAQRPDLPPTLAHELAIQTAATYEGRLEQTEPAIVHYRKALAIEADRAHLFRMPGRPGAHPFHLRTGHTSLTICRQGAPMSATDTGTRVPRKRGVPWSVSGGRRNNMCYLHIRAPHRCVVRGRFAQTRQAAALACRRTGGGGRRSKTRPVTLGSCPPGSDWTRGSRPRRSRTCGMGLGTR